MSYTPNARKTMLNALAVTTMKLHTGYPGTIGANEVTGGAPAYAAKDCSYGASTSGEPRNLSASVVFDVPACTIEWASVWSGSNLLFIAPTAGSPFEFNCDLTANTIIAPNHGLTSGDQIVFFLLTPPSPLVAGTKYYVLGVSSDEFQVSETSGGAAVNLTAQADSGCLCSKIVPRVYASQDTHTVTAFPFGLPN